MPFVFWFVIGLWSMLLPTFLILLTWVRYG